jgi:hypothetical protein
MKKLLTLMIGFGLVLGTAFAAPPEQKEEPKKEAKKKHNKGKHKGETQKKEADKK